MKGDYKTNQKDYQRNLKQIDILERNPVVTQEKYILVLDDAISVMPKDIQWS